MQILLYVFLMLLGFLLNFLIACGPILFYRFAVLKAPISRDKAKNIIFLYSIVSVLIITALSFENTAITIFVFLFSYINFKALNNGYVFNKPRYTSKIKALFICLGSYALGFALSVLLMMIIAEGRFYNLVYSVSVLLTMLFFYLFTLSKSATKKDDNRSNLGDPAITIAHSHRMKSSRMVMLIFGIIFIGLQLLSLIGNSMSNNNPWNQPEFLSSKTFLFDIITLISYNFIGILGIVLFSVASALHSKDIKKQNNIGNTITTQSKHSLNTSKDVQTNTSIKEPLQDSEEIRLTSDDRFAPEKNQEQHQEYNVSSNRQRKPTLLIILCIALSLLIIVSGVIITMMAVSLANKTEKSTEETTIEETTEHSCAFSNGKCTVCGGIDEDYFYQIYLEMRLEMMSLENGIESIAKIESILDQLPSYYRDTEQIRTEAAFVRKQFDVFEENKNNVSFRVGYTYYILQKHADDYELWDLKKGVFSYVCKNEVYFQSFLSGKWTTADGKCSFELIDNEDGTYSLKTNLPNNKENSKEYYYYIDENIIGYGNINNYSDEFPAYRIDELETGIVKIFCYSNSQTYTLYDK